MGQGAPHRGGMDIREQAATYDLFMALTKWGSLAVAAVVLLLTVWFCVGAGPFAALGAAVILLAVGFILLKSKPKAKSGH